MYMHVSVACMYFFQYFFGLDFSVRAMFFGLIDYFSRLVYFLKRRINTLLGLVRPI
jgi:hypothetical protein